MAKDIVVKADELKEFVLDVDGCFHWWPYGSNRGHLNSQNLRDLADELDARNKAWDEQVAADLAHMAEWRNRQTHSP